MLGFSCTGRFIMPKVLGLICVVLFALHLAPFARSQSYANGADISYLAKCEQDGVVFKENGQPIGVLALLRERHYNWVRLRISQDPAAAPDKLPMICPTRWPLPAAPRAWASTFCSICITPTAGPILASRLRRRHRASSSTSSWWSRYLPRARHHRCLCRAGPDARHGAGGQRSDRRHVVARRQIAGQLGQFC